ncbi:dihydrodipicolinate synthase family protein [Lactonifactor longoviformis]|uniref:N-acetylneuraminate lyase n=1 Tax=Lactonifactor longoviformis DSM 17459 TaxID=1122155 RepID=A0A1M5CTQ1_9CLOT|nr:dihydrodipicolinate synthase family protein [Lactonifactor longoviformis]POP32405.1 dihydrodipicolinate synthase family protein [Lactonifactor longoviformis]SHF57692.1 N-acetylneuraminate lyase [Lactonifactor longoviformis DSM 17459]
MDVKRFSGVYPAVITPFNEAGEVDTQKLTVYTEYLCGKVDGLFVGGSYGSGPIMTAEQRKTVAETVMAVAKGRVPVILMIGCTDTNSTIELAKHAQRVGADAVAAVTPCYYRHTEDVIIQYYRDLIQAVDLPVIAYNNPKYSNFCISGDLLAKLADIGLEGIKDSSADIALFYDYMAKVKKEGFLFLIGSQTHLVPAVVGGAHGVVSGLSNAFPEFIKEIYDACKAGAFQKARDMQLKANLLRSVTGSGIPVPFYHAVLPMLGIDIGIPKKPFLPRTEEEVERIRKALVETKMIIG